MIPADLDLRQMLLDEIRNDPKSISGICRQLESRGVKLHKLVITGYLRALADMGHIKAKDIPPSKVYYAVTPKKMDIYETVGHHLKEWGLTSDSRCEVALYCLERLFRRPIFHSELKRADASPVNRVPRMVDEARAEIRKMLGRARLQVPRNDPLYTSTKEHPEEYDRLMAEMILVSFNVRSLVREGRQVSLEGL